MVEPGGKATKQARQTPLPSPSSSFFLHISLYSLACDTSELMLGNVGFFLTEWTCLRRTHLALRFCFFFVFMMMNDFGFYSGHGACQGARLTLSSLEGFSFFSPD